MFLGIESKCKLFTQRYKHYIIILSLISIAIITVSVILLQLNGKTVINNGTDEKESDEPETANPVPLPEGNKNKIKTNTKPVWYFEIKNKFTYGIFTLFFAAAKQNWIRNKNQIKIRTSH